MDANSKETRRAADDAVLDLVSEYVDQVELGNSPQIAEICKDQPGLMEQVRSRVQTLQKLGLIQDRSARAGDRDFPERLGEYKLLSRLGRGGMGAVYLAEQESLKRRVAIKLVHPEYLYFSGTRERFQREALAVANLNHPCITPLYAFGEEQGVPYFTMAAVDGCTIQEVIQDFIREGKKPSDLSGADLAQAVVRLRNNLDSTEAPAGTPSIYRGSFIEVCFRIIREVAGALDHAHARGVIHRDIKPGNIMLTPRGNVLLLDFGLAQREGVSRMTRTGSRLGSIFYMSPEQLLNEPGGVGPASDLYSLGVTLYEMLTLTMPFPGDSEESVRQLILDGRPRSIRRLNPRISADAETACLTAMERDRDRRYTSAAALSADITNVLELRPVQARRAGAALQLRRLAARHKAATVAAILGATLVIGGPAFYGIQQKMANQRIQTALDNSNASLDVALRSIDSMVESAAQDLVDEPRMEELRRKYLTRALNFYEQLRERHSTNAAARVKSTEAAIRVGNIQHMLGDTDAAARTLTFAVELGRQLASESSAGRAEVLLLAQALDQRGLVAELQGKLADALGFFKEAVDRLQQLQSEDESVRKHLAIALDHLGSTIRRQGRDTEALQMQQSALDMMKQLRAGDPSNVEYARWLAAILFNRGEYHRARGENEPARRDFTDAITIHEDLKKLGAVAPQQREDEASIHAGLCGMFLLESKYDDARVEIDRAIAGYRALVSDFPKVARHRMRLAKVLGNSGLIARLDGNPARAMIDLEESRILYATLHKEQPLEPVYSIEAAPPAMSLSAIHVAAKDYQKARAVIGEAVAGIASVLARDPAQREARRYEARLYMDLSRIETAEENHDKAVEYLQKAVESFESLATTQKQDAKTQMQFAGALEDYGIALGRANRPEQGAAAIRRAISIMDGLDSSVKNAAMPVSLVATMHVTLGEQVLQQGHREEAVSVFERAVETHTKLRKTPGGTGYTDNYSEAVQILVREYTTDGQYTKIAELLESQAEAFPEDGDVFATIGALAKQVRESLPVAGAQALDSNGNKTGGSTADLGSRLEAIERRNSTKQKPSK